MRNVYHIYDKIFKRIFTLSNTAVINLINGLFFTNYPVDAELTYLNKEFHNGRMDGRFADMFIRIGERDTYHLEAQLEKDETIVLRAFEYCFYTAMENRENSYELHFPEPMVIYLGNVTNIPEESELTVVFGNHSKASFTVRNFVYLDHDVQELNQRKLVILIPFQLLKLREIIKKDPSPENLLA